MRHFFLLFIFICSSVVRSQEVLSVKPVLTKLSDSTSLSLLAAGTLSTLLIEPYDDRIRDDWRNHQQMSESAADIGDFLGTGIASVMIMGGQYLFDPREESWRSHARALIWETTAVYVMKYSFGRQRPGNSRNYQSFPSGHTAVAFATATSLAYSYGWKMAVISYPIAAFVGASRWADDAHWGSDVIAGAFVGIIMGRACALDETVSDQSNQAHFSPIITPDLSGINYLYSF